MGDGDGGRDLADQHMYDGVYCDVYDDGVSG